MDVNEIKAPFQIIGDRIKKLEIENDFVFIDLTDEGIKREIGVSYEVSDPFILDDSEETFAGQVMMYIDLEVSDDECKACISLELEGCFIIDEPNSEEVLREMLPINGCAALYSIARGIISSVTSHMCGNGSILIPMINTFELRDSIEEDEYIATDETDG